MFRSTGWKSAALILGLALVGGARPVAAQPTGMDAAVDELFRDRRGLRGNPEARSEATAALQRLGAKPRPQYPEALRQLVRQHGRAGLDELESMLVRHGEAHAPDQRSRSLRRGGLAGLARFDEPARSQLEKWFGRRNAKYDKVLGVVRGGPLVDAAGRPFGDRGFYPRGADAGSLPGYSRTPGAPDFDLQASARRAGVARPGELMRASQIEDWGETLRRELGARGHEVARVHTSNGVISYGLLEDGKFRPIVDIKPAAVGGGGGPGSRVTRATFWNPWAVDPKTGRAGVRFDIHGGLPLPADGRGLLAHQLLIEDIEMPAGDIRMRRNRQAIRARRLRGQLGEISGVPSHQVPYGVTQDGAFRPELPEGKRPLRAADYTLKTDASGDAVGELRRSRGRVAPVLLPAPRTRLTQRIRASVDRLRQAVRLAESRFSSTFRRHTGRSVQGGARVAAGYGQFLGILMTFHGAQLSARVARGEMTPLEMLDELRRMAVSRETVAAFLIFRGTAGVERISGKLFSRASRTSTARMVASLRRVAPGMARVALRMTAARSVFRLLGRSGAVLIAEGVATAGMVVVDAFQRSPWQQQEGLQGTGFFEALAQDPAATLGWLTAEIQEGFGQINVLETVVLAAAYIAAHAAASAALAALLGGAAIGGPVGLLAVAVALAVTAIVAELLGEWVEYERLVDRIEDAAEGMRAARGGRAPTARELHYYKRRVESLQGYLKERTAAPRRAFAQVTGALGEAASGIYSEPYTGWLRQPLPGEGTVQPRAANVALALESMRGDFAEAARTWRHVLGTQVGEFHRAFPEFRPFRARLEQALAAGRGADPEDVERRGEADYMGPLLQEVEELVARLPEDRRIAARGLVEPLLQKFAAMIEELDELGRIEKDAREALEPAHETAYRAVWTRHRVVTEKLRTMGLDRLIKDHAKARGVWGKSRPEWQLVYGYVLKQGFRWSEVPMPEDPEAVARRLREAYLLVKELEVLGKAEQALRPHLRARPDFRATRLVLDADARRRDLEAASAASVRRDEELVRAEVRGGDAVEAALADARGDLLQAGFTGDDLARVAAAYRPVLTWIGEHYPARLPSSLVEAIARAPEPSRIPAGMSLDPYGLGGGAPPVSGAATAAVERANGHRAALAQWEEVLRGAQDRSREALETVGERALDLSPDHVPNELWDQLDTAPKVRGDLRGDLGVLP